MFLCEYSKFKLMSEQKSKKKKKKSSLLKRIGGKIRGEEKDEMVMETLNELKDIVSNMKDVFEQFESGYEIQLEEERTAWQKFQSKLPKFLQSKQLKNENRRIERIKSNKSTLAELEDNFNKLEIVLSTSTNNLESLGEVFVDTAIPGSPTDDAIEELEQKMEDMQQNLANALDNINVQISLIKTALDNMAAQLDEQNVILEGVDEKIDVIDSKLDRAQEMLKKISKKITGNRLLMLVIAGTATAVIITQLVVK